MTDERLTREQRFRAWRKLGFGVDEAWRRADMPDIDPPAETGGDYMFRQKTPEEILEDIAIGMRESGFSEDEIDVMIDKFRK